MKMDSKKSNLSFENQLLQVIIDNIDNYHIDNYDSNRFGEKRLTAVLFKKYFRAVLFRFFKFRISYLNKGQYKWHIDTITPYFDGLNRLFNLLATDDCRSLLVNLIAFRILGYEKIKLPLNTTAFWNNRKNLEKIKNRKDCIEVEFVDNKLIRLYLFDLIRFGVPVKIYYRAGGINNFLYVKQYEYSDNTVTIKPEDGDVILDCGACWGDTALFFANEVGEKGHVYSFEFISDNIKVLEKNIKINPQLSNRISIVPKPLGKRTGEKITYTQTGPGSRLNNNQSLDGPTVETISIDDFCKAYKVSQVDFIKMDIEGSELPSLMGAVETIRKHKPKLAISLYHSMDDFVNIPEYIESLNLGYSFYLKHGTIHAEETVLIASSNQPQPLPIAIGTQP
jgi:FkbM family methyltransferase